MYEQLDSPPINLSPRDEAIRERTIDRLQAAPLHDKIHTNHLTLAMIRPHTESSVNFTVGHTPAEDTLEEQIESLGIHTKISMTLDDEAIADFYADIIDRQQLKPPEAIFAMQSRWHEFQQLMTSGPSTILLLESQQASAIETWRVQLGHWNIEEQRDTATLRGKFGIHNHNNLFHGSDSVEAALRELHIIIDCLKRTRHHR